MEDLASMITEFLGSEEGMAQLKAVSEALGLGSDGTAPAAGGSASAGEPQKRQSVPFAQEGVPPVDMNTVLLMQRAMSLINRQDKNTELLRALKPHFSPERAKRADDAIRIIQLLRLLPLIKEAGFFGGGGGK